MAEVKDQKREPKPQPGSETPDARPDTPSAADKANDQNKQKDKPDSGRNEDG